MPENYFAYLPETGLARQWGLEVTAAGYTQVGPQEPYPSPAHPADHQFTFEGGRQLHAYQLIFISQGAGMFQSHATGREPLEVRAGNVILVVPGVWHRYAPHRQTGWVEHWIECRGTALDRMRQRHLLRPDRPVTVAGDLVHMLSCFESIHRWAGHSPGQRRIELATLAAHLYVLARHGAADEMTPHTTLDRAIQRAQFLIAQHADQPLNIRRLAGQLNVPYACFRKVFRQRTGIAPKQYHVQMRLRRAQALLANTPASVTQIAATLGYDSPYHLSQQFKRYFGLAPQHWRKRSNPQAR